MTVYAYRPRGHDPRDPEKKKICLRWDRQMPEPVGDWMLAWAVQEGADAALARAEGFDGDRKARVQKPDWYACYPFDKPKPTEFERSRPLVASERVLATAMAMAWAPVLSPLHLAGDLVEATGRRRRSFSVRHFLVIEMPTSSPWAAVARSQCSRPEARLVRMPHF